jgi:hypothetical protein
VTEVAKNMALSLLNGPITSLQDELNGASYRERYKSIDNYEPGEISVRGPNRTGSGAHLIC